MWERVNLHPSLSKKIFERKIVIRMAKKRIEGFFGLASSMIKRTHRTDKYTYIFDGNVGRWVWYAHCANRERSGSVKK